MIVIGYTDRDSINMIVIEYTDKEIVWYGNCLFDKIKSTLKHNSKYIISES